MLLRYLVRRPLGIRRSNAGGSSCLEVLNQQYQQRSRYGLSSNTNRGPLLTDGTYLGYKIDESDEMFRPLWSRIEEASTGNNVVEAVQEWKAAGNRLSKPLVNNILLKMCLYSWFVQAHKFVRWVDKEEGFLLDEEVDEVVRMDILRQSGNADRLASRFYKITNKTEPCYLLLLDSCSSKPDKAEQLLQELRASGLMTSARAYTTLFKIYRKLEMRDKAMAKMDEAEDSGFPPDAAMYWELFCHKSTVFSDVDVGSRVQAALDKMVDDDRTNTSRRYVLRLNAVVGRRDKVDSAWKAMLASPPVSLNDYLAGMSAYGLLGDVGTAEAISEKVQRLLGGVPAPYQHNIVLHQMYCRLGMLDKAVEMLKTLASQKLHFEQCSLLIDGYLEQGRLDDAAECFRSYVVKGDGAKHPQRFLTATLSKLLDSLARRRDVKSAEELMSLAAGAGVKFSGAVYKSLVRAYGAAGIPPGDEMVKRMADAGITVPDGVVST